MKYALAFLLFGLSAVLGLVVLMNVYVAVSTADNSQVRTITKPNIVMLGTFALLAIVSFVGGITILRQRGEKS